MSEILQAAASGSTGTDDFYSIRLATDLDGVVGMKGTWEGMNYHPETDIGLFSSVVLSRSNVIRPHVATLSRNGEPISLLIARLEQTELACKIGYHALYHVPLKAITVLYGGIVGEVNEIVAEKYLQHLKETLRANQADVVFLNGLRMDSPVLKAAKAVFPGLLRNRISASSDHWIMNLPQSQGVFQEQMRARHQNWLSNIKRWTKKLYKDHDDAVEYREYDGAADLERLCVDCELIAKKTYQRALGFGFMDNPEIRQRMRVQAESGKLRAAVLSVKGEPVAFWIGSVSRDSFYSDYLAFDPAYERYRPGNIVFMRVIENLYENGVKHIDFGTGEAAYKERFGDTRWSESSICLFAPRPRLVAVNALQTMALLTEMAGKFILKNMNLTAKVRKIWRGKITRGGSAPASNEPAPEKAPE